MSHWHHRMSVSAISSMGWTLEEDLAFWAAAGIDFVGLAMHKLEPLGYEQAIGMVADAGLRVSSIVGAPILPLDDPSRWSACQEDLARVADGAARVSAGCLFVNGRPGRLDPDESVDAFAAAIAPVAEHARGLVPLALEHTNVLRRDIGFIHTLADAVDLAEQIGVGIDVELNNCWVERRLPDTFRRGVLHFTLVQVSDFVVGTFETPNRAVPGDGDMPLERLLTQVLEAGYTGPFDLEVIGPRIEAEGYAAAIARGAAWLSDTLARLGA